MLEGIDRSGPQNLPAAVTKAVAAASGSLAAASAPLVPDAVIVSLSSPLSDLAPQASAPSAMDRADQETQRGMEALAHIAEAKAKAASSMKEFLRKKLEALKKQLEVLRIMGTNALEIAKGSVKIAREVTKACRDYAAATKDEKAAGTTPADGTAADGTTTVPTDKEAQKQAEDLQAMADKAPDDASATDPADALKDPDERFFYEAFRLLKGVRKTLREAQQADIKLHGFKHAKEFKKLNRREHELELAVIDSYKAMKTGGDLKGVDAALDRDANSVGSTGILV